MSEATTKKVSAKVKIGLIVGAVITVALTAFGAVNADKIKERLQPTEVTAPAVSVEMATPAVAEPAPVTKAVEEHPTKKNTG